MSTTPSKLEIHLTADMAAKLGAAAERTGCTPEEITEQALRRLLFGRRGGNAVYLSAPINALVEGYYVENTTISQIKERGDFGLGTFNYLDGEMVVLDGKVYQIRSDGKVHEVNDYEKSPFACVTFFSPDTFDDIEGISCSGDFNDLLDRLIPSPNMLYAIRIDGLFRYVKTRAAPRCDNYLPLTEATKKQAVFEFSNIEGSLAGFYTPAYMERLNAPGYHLHFLTAERTRGGHLLSCEPSRIHIGIQHVPELEVGLPFTLDFLTADLTRDTSDDLEKAEK